MSRPAPGDGEPSPTRDERIDAVCDRFEAAWRAGERPRIADYLGDSDGPDRRALLRELLTLDRGYRRRAGEAPTPEQYRDLVPDGEATLRDWLGSAWDEATLAGPPRGPVEEASPDTQASADGPRFEVIGFHARGGLGTVSRALDRELGREVALKQIQDRIADRAESRRRFEWEAKVTGRLQHPGIVPIYALGRDERGRPFYAMRFVEGQTLRRAIADDRDGDPATRALRLREMLGRFLDACDAVAYAHSRGVIHRDLKPDNILLGPFGETIVVDWGLAKVLTPEVGPAEAPRSRDATPDALDVTWSDEVVGTPAYMSPEQASGHREAVGTAADIYGLGATLFHVLTGRAPIETGPAAEVLDRARRGEAAAPRSVAPEVPSALDAVCRRALAFRPEDRYASVADLADDVKRWLADEPVSTWREPWPARVRRWARRHRALAASAAAVALVLLVVGVIGGLWSARQRQARLDRLERVYLNAQALRDRAESAPTDLARWNEALAAVRQASEAVGGPADSEPARRLLALRDEVEAAAESAGRDQELLAELVDVRTALKDLGPAGVDAGYANAFRRYGLDVDSATSSEAAVRLSGRPRGVLVDLVPMLEDWVSIRRRQGMAADRLRPLLALARALDPDPDRARSRELLAEPDLIPHREALLALANDALAAKRPAPGALLLARSLEEAGEGGAALKVLRGAARDHPDDVWANYELAEALKRARPSRTEEAIRYYSIARALKPETAHVLAHLLERRARPDEAEAVLRDLARRIPDAARHLVCLGSHLKAKGQAAEAREILAQAIDALRAALRSQPEDFAAHFRLGLALETSGDLDGAIAEYRTVLRIDPDLAEAQTNLGIVLKAKGDLDGAIEAYRAALRLDPGLVEAQINLGFVLQTKGDLNGAVAACRAALEIDPDSPEANYNLGQVLQRTKDYPGAIKAYREVLRVNPDSAKAHNGLGVTLEASGATVDAIAAFRAALRINPNSAEVHYNIGRALQRTRDHEGAIDAYRATLRIKPDLAEAHCNLGHALLARGRFQEALAELERGHELGSRRPRKRWTYPSARWVDQCRRMVALEAKLSGILAGGSEPADAPERLGLAMVCYHKRLHHAAARFFEEAFAGSPDLEGDAEAGHRYNAACNAALAAAGAGEDAPPPTDQERAECRRKALAWLKADLADWSRRLDSGRAEERLRIRAKLREMRADPDLAPLRDADTLSALPEDDRAACRALWAEVEALLGRADKDQAATGVN